MLGDATEPRRAVCGGLFYTARMTMTNTSLPAAGQKLPTNQVVPLMTALLVAVFAFQLNASMLSPALATMEVELDATTAQIGMTQTAFFTAAAVFALFMPRWGDLIGRR